MTGTVLITRPRDDAEILAHTLQARGWGTLIDPMLEIRLLPCDPVDLSGVQALLFTSTNGVRAFAAYSDVRNLPAYAVGDATADAAQTVGFTAVQSAEGDAAALTTFVHEHCSPETGTLLHATGTHHIGNLIEKLQQAGFAARPLELYEAIPATTLAPETVQALYDGRIDAVLFFSPRTARTFVRLVQERGLTEQCRAVTALCLSEAVAKAASDFWRQVKVAARPDQESLLALL